MVVTIDIVNIRNTFVNLMLLVALQDGNGGLGRYSGHLLQFALIAHNWPQLALVQLASNSLDSLQFTMIVPA